MGRRSKVKPGKYILLKDVPIDIQESILQRQVFESDLCKCPRPLDYALYKIIRDYQHIKDSGESIVLCYHGHTFAPDDLQISFTGNQVVIKACIPITSKVGRHLNYERITGTTSTDKA